MHISIMESPEVRVKSVIQKHQASTERSAEMNRCKVRHGSATAFDE